MKFIIAILLCIFSFECWGYSGNLIFTSSDKKLEQTFHWAQKMALSYAHNGSDPVGYWYEAALPGRNAFCMRDASHQSMGAEILGLSRHNFNMMEKFAENISESKDWCSHWEIDKDNNPCPADYVDDNNFWYNLNANFDVLFACWRLYEWTGDEQYLKNEKLTNFFERTVDDFVNRWQLGPEEIMVRPRKLNVKDATIERYREVRGLPSYVENYPGLTVSSDLVAAIYAGFDAYSRMMYVRGKQVECKKYRNKAEAYRMLLENDWWNSNINAYHTFWTYQDQFADGEGLTFLLWFNAVQQTDRIHGTISKIMSRTDWNIENISYFPLLWYRYNHIQEGYDILAGISTKDRSDYPEVSYGMIEGVISGTMGIMPSASQKKVTTLPKLVKDKEHDFLQIENLPMLKGHITVRHDGSKCSSFINNTPEKLTWRASFMGKIDYMTVNGRKQKVKTYIDLMGNTVSYVEVTVLTGAKAIVQTNKIP